MVLKGIYKLCILIGSGLLIVFGSCDKQDIDKIVKTNYYYINNTTWDIELSAYSTKDELISNYSILKGDTLIIIYETEGGAGPFQYPEKGNYADSLYIKLNDEKYVSLKQDYDSIFFEKSYRKVKISDVEYYLFYEFTNDDFVNAVLLD